MISTTKNKKKKHPQQKFNNSVCNNKMTFQDCELAVLREAVDKNEVIVGKTMAMNESVKKMIGILEDFLVRKKLLCYGGTAINNILPKIAQFYNPEIEIPDYDFYSENALEDCKELADIYYREGFNDVEAKSGVHLGTYKVFVNFIPIADVSSMNKGIYEGLQREAVVVAGIHYVPPDFLRMGIYLELSRPNGDVSRWEKVFKRLELLNKYYPLQTNKNCEAVNFQRRMETDMEHAEKLYIVVRDSFIDQGVVFFGGYATSLYSKYMTAEEQRLVDKIPDFDVLTENPQKTALIVKEELERNGFNGISMVEYPAVDDVIPECIEILVKKETMAFLYKPVACHSYNTISLDGREVNVATIDTILAFYLSFLYTKTPYNKERLLCMAKFLFDVQMENKLNQVGLLKRFTNECYGKQKQLIEIRMEKAEKYKELEKKEDKKSRMEYERWFLKYVPSEEVEEGKGKNKKPLYMKNNNKRTYKKRHNNKNKKNRIFKRTRKGNFLF